MHPEAHTIKLFLVVDSHTFASIVINSTFSLNDIRIFRIALRITNIVTHSYESVVAIEAFIIIRAKTLPTSWMTSDACSIIFLRIEAN